MVKEDYEHKMIKDTYEGKEKPEEVVEKDNKENEEETADV